MNAISTLTPTMTSLDIAALVDSRHDKVRQSIERLAERGAITLPPLGEVSNDGPGPKTIGVYLVGKRDSYVIVAQLSPEFTGQMSGVVKMDTPGGLQESRVFSLRGAHYV